MSVVSMYVKSFTVNGTGTVVKLFYDSAFSGPLQFASVTRDTSLTGSNATGTITIFNPTDYTAAVHVSAASFAHLLSDLAMSGGEVDISITYDPSTLAVSAFAEAFERALMVPGSIRETPLGPPPAVQTTAPVSIFGLVVMGLFVFRGFRLFTGAASPKRRRHSPAAI